MKKWYVEEEITIGNWRRTSRRPKDEADAVAMARQLMRENPHNYRAAAVEIPDMIEPLFTPDDARREAYIASLGDPAGNKGRVARLLRNAGVHGMTCDEIEARDGMQFTTAGAIIIAMRDDGWVEQSRLEPTRKTRRHSRACVWVMRVEQAPENERVKVRMGKGRYKIACEQAYAMMVCDAWEEARHILGLAIGEEGVDAPAPGG